MDYLDNFIQLHHIKGEIKILCRFQGDWHLEHPASDKPMGVFHIISKGQCCIKLDSQCLHLKAGDVVFFPYGTQHELASCPTLLDIPPEQLIPIQKQQTTHFTLCQNHQGGSDDFEMFCGFFHYRHSSTLLELPKWHLAENNHSVMALLALLKKESEENLGGQTVINALANVLFTYLIRDYLSKNNVEHGILAALQDKRLKVAIQAMLTEPEKEWSMESLADISAMSRSNFIRLFKNKSGISAGKFLTALRLQKATFLLQHSELSIQEIALQVGYQSEAHFSKLFKAHQGKSPSELRSSKS